MQPSIIRITALGLGLALLASSATAQQPPATRPSLLFKEEWKQPPYRGKLNDETRRATQEAVANPGLELKLYGPDARDVGVYNHEGRCFAGAI